MDILFLFINPKKFFEERKEKNYLWFIVPIYIVLFILLYFSARNLFGSSREVNIGILIQIIFNLVFFLFLSLFIKVFIKIFGVERKLFKSIEDGLLISLPSFTLFVILFYFLQHKFLSLSYPLIYFFTFQKYATTLSKILFFFYFPPRALLFVYTLIGIRYMYNLNWKKSLLLSIIIYFIFFLTYIL